MEQGHLETDIRYLIILKAEYGANFCDVILLGENVKIGKLNNEILQNDEFYIAVKIQGNCFKTQ